MNQRIEQLLQWQEQFKPYHLNWYTNALLESWLSEQKQSLKRQGITNARGLVRAKINDGEIDPRFLIVANEVGLNKILLRRVFRYFIVNRLALFERLIANASYFQLNLRQDSPGYQPGEECRFFGVVRRFFFCFGLPALLLVVR